MAEVNLSKAVRSNLLSLQSTANSMAKTQERLATGLKVNSALDNPTNFFTAGSLNSRASDMANLLDGMSNGIKTIEAANNGLTSITKTVEQMQSTLRQARQDKSFKTTSHSVSLGSTPAGTEQLTLSGGAVGSTPVSVALTTTAAVPATSATIAGGAFTAVDFTPTAATAGTTTSGAFGAAMNFAVTPATNGAATLTTANFATSTFGAGDTITFDVSVDGGAAQSISISAANVAAVGNNDATIDDVSELAAAITAAGGVTGATVGSSGGNLTITSSTTGTGSTVALSNIAANDTSGNGTVTTAGLGAATSAAGQAAITPTLSFDVAVDGGAATTVTINAAAVAAVGDNDSSLESIAELQAIVDAQLGAGVTVGASGGGLQLTSATSGASSSVAISNVAAAGGITNTSGVAAATNTGTATGAAKTIGFNISINGGAAQAVSIDLADVQAVGDNNSTATAAELASIINSQTSSTVASVGTGGNLEFNSSTTGTGSTLAITGFAATGGATGTGIANATDAGDAAISSGGANVAKTVDALVSEINANTSLNTAIRASNDNGKLRLENLSTEDLTVVGVSTTSGNITGGTGGSNTTTVGGNDVRKNLVNQFNALRDQLDKLADDASFNGINLLRGDKLKLTFNETGTSTIDIQAKDADGVATSVNNTNLGIDTAAASDFDSDTAIDTRLTTLGDALGSLRSQASGFGSNLSIVQNRQDFTKNMINTLETGAANLTLADTNEEAANLLALQTRQQLSSTALSLASQADQAVLRLF